MTGSEYRSLMKISPDNAHRAVFDEYYNYVFTIVMNKLRSCASKEDIEECVSDVFAAVFLKLDSDLRYDGELAAFVNTVAKNKAIDMYRSLSTRRNADITAPDIETVPAETDVAGDAEIKDIRRIVYDTIAGLGEPDSSIIILKYYYGLTSAEIGKKLSISPAAVRKRCERALKRMKKTLSDKNIML